MSEYRRARVLGGTYFFTVVTYRRQRFLTAPESREALRHAIADVRKVLPFIVDARVLLPDHLHCIWTLPEGDLDFSNVYTADWGGGDIAGLDGELGE